MAQGRNLLRRSDSVGYLRYYCRPGDAITMPPRDPVVVLTRHSEGRPRYDNRAVAHSAT